MELVHKYKQTAILVIVLLFSWGISFYGSTRLLMQETQEIVVPKVIGFPLSEAEHMLLQRKINVKIEQQVDTAVFPENTVISQSIEPGTIVKENRTMYLQISKQKDRVEVPNFIEKDLVEAKKIIEKQNLKLTNIAYGCNKKIKSGKIISQNPLHDDLSSDKSIQLLVSTGSCTNQFIIENLVGEKIDSRIKKEFLEKDIELKQLTSKFSRDNINRAKVLTQEPIAGSVVKIGDHVVLNME